MPFILGAEYAGVVTSAPKDSKFKKGDRVFGSTQGAFAEKAVVQEMTCFPIPKGMSYEQAAGLFVTYPTSYAALALRAKLQPGEVCLIHAGAGGVGLVAIQVAKALGAKVIATASNQEKLDVCKRAGADEVVNYRDKDWMKKVKELNGGEGVDVIYDPVGMVVPSLKCIKWNGRILVIGFAAGQIEKIPANIVLLKNISIVGLHWGAYYGNEVETIPKVWEALFKLLEAKKITPFVYDKIYQGLESVSAGLQDLADRKTWGKVVVKVASDGSKL